MDHIDKVLTTSSDSPHKFSVAIHAALAIGKAAMNKYYNKTDHSEVYRIAMTMFSFSKLLYVLTSTFEVLHPHHKLNYFTKHNWEDDWIQTAREIVRTEFNRSYTGKEADVNEDCMELDIGDTVCLFLYVFVFKC